MARAALVLILLLSTNCTIGHVRPTEDIVWTCAVKVRLAGDEALAFRHQYLITYIDCS